MYVCIGPETGQKGVFGRHTDRDYAGLLFIELISFLKIRGLSTTVSRYENGQEQDVPVPGLEDSSWELGLELSGMMDRVDQGTVQLLEVGGLVEERQAATTPLPAAPCPHQPG